MRVILAVVVVLVAVGTAAPTRAQDGPYPDVSSSPGAGAEPQPVVDAAPEQAAAPDGTGAGADAEPQPVVDAAARDISQWARAYAYCFADYYRGSSVPFNGGERYRSVPFTVYSDRGASVQTDVRWAFIAAISRRFLVPTWDGTMRGLRFVGNPRCIFRDSLTKLRRQLLRQSSTIMDALGPGIAVQWPPACATVDNTDDIVIGTRCGF